MWGGLNIEGKEEKLGDNEGFLVYMIEVKELLVIRFEINFDGKIFYFNYG